VSADNFWYVAGRKVICGNATHYDETGGPDWLYRLRLRWQYRLGHWHYAYVGKSRRDALRWADANYAEYGVWW
jgi:hypothetical protein